MPHTAVISAPANVAGVTEAEWLDAPKRQRFAEYPARNEQCGRVPYDLLAQVQVNALELHPNAQKAVALWTPASEADEIHVEVWVDGRARVFSDREIREGLAA